MGVPLLLGVVTGAVVALAGGGRSTELLLSGSRPAPAAARVALAAPRTSPTAAAAPRTSPTPAPAPMAVGQLGSDAVLVAAGERVAAVAGGRLFFVDAGGAAAVALPAGLTSVAVAAKAPGRVVAAGSAIQVSDDGGRSWRAPRTAPPGPGPYRVLLVGPDDADVWFFQHGARLLRTRDAGLSWRELPGLPDLAAPVMLGGDRADTQLLLDGSAVAVLEENGVRVAVRGGLPAPVRSAGLAGGNLVAATRDGRAFAYRGQAWEAVAPAFGGVLASAAGKAWAGDGLDRTGVRGRLGVSGDGSTWAAAAGLPADQSVSAVGVDRAGGVVVAYCSGGDLYRSGDGGLTFALFSTALRG